MTQDSQIVLKSYCNNCLQENDHNLIAEREQPWPHTDDAGRTILVERMHYQFVECRGCHSVGLRRTWSCTATPDVEIDYFPPAVSRRLPVWLSGIGFVFNDAKSQISGLLREVYSSIFSGNNRLALMGTRAVVDVALTDKLGDIGGFGKKLAEAKNKGWITDIHYRTLNAAIDAGNAASHRAFRPDTKQLEFVLDIVEHLIQLLYVLEPCAEEIAKQTPPRAPKAGGQAKP